jgi:DNA-directed RNA polymerase specialized sigma subunit
MTHAERLALSTRRGQSRDSERALFLRYRAGRDPALRDHLVTRYLPMARRIARAYARRQARVAFEDLEQVMDGLAACRARDGASFDRTSELETDEGLSLRDNVGSEDIGYAHAEDSATVMHLMRVLTAREKRVLLLRFGADLTQAEVGDIVGCTQMHVSRIQRDALAKLSIVAGASPLLEPTTGARTTRAR